MAYASLPDRSLESQEKSDGRPGSKDKNDKGLWSSMLDNVATGRRLPSRNLIVLGGNTETQKEFLQSLESEPPKRQDRHKKKPPIANNFALGYTYQDMLDADHEDILARLSIYFLTEYSPSYADLLRPLLTPQAIPETLLVILLDWQEPWSWVQKLRDWITLVRNVTESLSSEAQQALEENMKDWQERRRGVAGQDTVGTTSSADANVVIPLGQGEWDEALGLPLCVVCQNANHINNLEIERSWREEDFDFILQTLRTILLKHGASLIYTAPIVQNSLPTLIHSSLGIHSMLKKQALKHNVIDREKILVPPNWDSWGKIRVIREGFDVEGVSSKWGIDISYHPSNDKGDNAENKGNVNVEAPTDGSPVVELYQGTITDPYASQRAAARKKPTIEVTVPTMQAFLASQQETLARLNTEDEKTASSATSTSSTFSANTTGTAQSTHDRMADQIGPVQVNMGGIQVDADDVVKKLQTQSRKAAGKEEGESTPKGKGEGANMSTPDMKAQNESLKNFFSELTKRTASNSQRGTPSKSPSKEPN